MYNFLKPEEKTAPAIYDETDILTITSIKLKPLFQKSNRVL